MYEGGTREPLFIRWPQVIEAGTVCNEPVTSPDFYPTLLEAAELDLIPQQHVDGVSLLPLLKGEPALKREAIFWHYPHYGNQGGTPGSSVRMGAYKLIEFFEDKRLELYNLEEDVGETKDLSESHPEQMRLMNQVLKEWQQAVEAKIPQLNSDWSSGP
jgi:arylsulfatase A-like enzyme